MKRQGNMLILTLVACALLALVLVVGVEVANLGKATQKNEVAVLQMEQLHRTAMADGFALLNRDAKDVTVGHRILADEPIRGQTRALVVEEKKGRVVTLKSENRLTGGASRIHRVQCLVVPKEARMNFQKDKQALFFGGQLKDVNNRWLSAHADEDVVLLCHPSLTIGGGSGVKKPLSGSLLITGWSDQSAAAVLNTDLSVSGNMVCNGNLSLRHGLSCQRAWVDGTLTIDEGIRLRARDIYLERDVSLAVLKRLEGTVYMPNPPDLEVLSDEEKEGLPTVLPLPADVRPQTDKRLYLMLQQLS